MPADGEPHWLPQDRLEVQAFDLEEKSKCPCGCGRPAAESMAKENQLRYAGEVIRCHARAAMDRSADFYRKKDGADTAGLMTRLSRGPTGKL